MPEIVVDVDDLFPSSLTVLHTRIHNAQAVSTGTPVTVRLRVGSGAVLSGTAEPAGFLTGDTHMAAGVVWKGSSPTDLAALADHPGLPGGAPVTVGVPVGGRMRWTMWKPGPRPSEVTIPAELVEVLGLVARWRSSGTRRLVTATLPHRVARRVWEQLGADPGVVVAENDPRRTGRPAEMMVGPVRIVVGPAGDDIDDVIWVDGIGESGDPETDVLIRVPEGVDDPREWVRRRRSSLRLG